MSHKVEIPVHPMCLEKVEALMKRLSQIIDGNLDEPFKIDSGEDWQLDSMNNWWASIIEGKLFLSYRYGMTDKFRTLVPYLIEVFK